MTSVFLRVGGALACAALGTPFASAQQFDLVDITAQSGMNFNPAGGRMGLAVGDYDGDGWQDVAFFGAGDHTPILYRNQGALITAGQNVPWFEDVSAIVFPANDLPTSLGAFADLDNDGDQDLAVVRRFVDRTTGQPDQALNAVTYYENTLDVNGQFTIGTAPDRVAFSPSTISTLALVDYDGDSDLDIFSAFSGYQGSYVNSRCFMVENDGLPNLVDVSPTFGAGLAVTTRALCAVFADFNGDMLPDLHCSRDFHHDFHCRNMGGGLFMDVSSPVGVSNTGSDMGLAVGDIDNDGDLDIYSTNINYGVMYVNNGSGVFADEAAIRGCRSFANGGNTTIGWGTNLVDLDNDRDLDLTMVPTGPGSGNVWRNDGTGNFTDVTVPTGIDLHGYSIIDFDFDRDGDQDLLAMGNGMSQRPRLYENTQQSSHHWLVLELEGRHSNRDAIGAQIFITTPDGTRQMRALMAGHSYRCGTPKTVHFGLGDSIAVTEIEVRWPSGRIMRRGPFFGDRYIHITEK